MDDPRPSEDGWMMSERMGKLRQIVETMHRCDAVHERSTPVNETFGRKTAFEGVVETFALTGHPEAKRCYAWSHQKAGEMQYVTVLRVPPVDSPAAAVRVAFTAKAGLKRWIEIAIQVMAVACIIMILAGLILSAWWQFRSH